MLKERFVGQRLRCCPTKHLSYFLNDETAQANLINHFKHKATGDGVGGFLG